MKNSEAYIRYYVYADIRSHRSGGNSPSVPTFETYVTLIFGRQLTQCTCFWNLCNPSIQYYMEVKSIIAAQRDGGNSPSVPAFEIYVTLIFNITLR